MHPLKATIIHVFLYDYTVKLSSLSTTFTLIVIITIKFSLTRYPVEKEGFLARWSTNLSAFFIENFFQVLLTEFHKNRPKKELWRKGCFIVLFQVPICSVCLFTTLSFCVYNSKLNQLSFTCSESTIETLAKGVKYVQN